MNANTDSRRAPDPDFGALKDMARLRFLVNFEAIATAGNDDDALVEGTPKRQ